MTRLVYRVRGVFCDWFPFHKYKKINLSFFICAPTTINVDVHSPFLGFKSSPGLVRNTTLYVINQIQTLKYGAFGHYQTFQAQKTPYICILYMGVGYNAIIDSALIFISASPSVTPCHGHTKNRMQYYANIYNYTSLGA